MNNPEQKSRSIYSSPFRVYLVIAILAFAGIYCGFHLPVSLFPNSSKPFVMVRVPYGNMTPEEFLNSFGRDMEYLLRQSNAKGVEVEKLEANYQRREVEYDIEFKWGSDPKIAENEVTNRANSFAARLPEESRDGLGIWLDNENQGFFAASFYSNKQSLDSLHELLEPVLLPKLAQVKDASKPEIFNPTRKEVRIELRPEVMAGLHLLPSDIDRALNGVLRAYAGGSVAMETRQYFVEMPRLPIKVEDLARIPIKTGSGKWVHLSDVARIDMGPKTADTRSFKTSGTPSLIVFATPRPGGNVKRMSEEMRTAIEAAMPSLPKDVQYKVLVDPSEFIRSAINNVFHEVFIAAMLAVVILFLFIGSFRNVVTAAIEIPLSMVLAFILMRFFGINLNLISLGGLALSAGMNVDASVVVMENIFRKFEEKTGTLDFWGKLALITEAVKEVRFAIIASTVASLVVFLPLVFTSGLSYAILGDLAMAVVFSHGFSAAVALVLVPTIRLQLLEKETKHAKPFIETQIVWLETTYHRLLNRFLYSPRAKGIALASVPLVIALILALLLPRLPKEIVAIPDTDWIFVNIRTQGNTLLRQMEVFTEEIEGEVLTKYGDKIQYTFTQVNGLNQATIMSRLKSKSDMNVVWDQMEKRFVNTPFTKFRVGPWNPSELPIPDPPHFQISVRGPDAFNRSEIAKEVSELIQEKNIFPRVWTKPNVEADASIRIEPHLDQWEALTKADPRITPAEIADLSRIATSGRRIGQLPWKNTLVPVMLRFPRGYVEAPEDLSSLPVGVSGRIVPLKALANVQITLGLPTIYRIDDQELNLVEGKLNRSEERKAPEYAARAEVAVNEWKKQKEKQLADQRVTVAFEDANKDLTEAVAQLRTAVALSILLIFFVLMFQFGSVMESLLVLVAIPLGFIGVMLSLFIFRSTLSLNSILGIILLNGISVANSILLVDFTKRLHADGLSPREAALQASSLRLRPILITSLTTILGMLPIAIGMGEGGRILQPLGIAVSGGLWVSMVLTLFLVPALHVWTLEKNGIVPAFKDFLARLRWSSLKSAPTTTMIIVVALILGSLAAVADPVAEKPPVDFSKALSQIIERSTAIGSARESLAALRSSNLPARLVFLPSISLVGARNEARGYGATATDLSHSVDLTASINLLKFGADYAGYRRANFTEEAQEQAVLGTILAAENSGVKGLVALIQASLEVKIYDEIADALLRSLEIARERYRQGLLPSQEVDKVLIDFDNSTASLRDAEIRLKTAKAKMVELLGHDNVQVEWPWIKTLGDKNLEIKMGQLAKRPDWLAAEARLKAADALVDQSFGKVLPSVDLSAGYGYLKQNTVKSEGDYWSARLTITVPLFDRLTNFSDYRANVHNKMAAEYDLEQVRRNARRDWESSKTAFDIALETAKTRESTLLTARNLYRDNLRRFHRGLTSANDLIVDQNRSANAELFAIRGWAQVHQSFTDMCHSLGRRLADCEVSNDDH